MKHFEYEDRLTKKENKMKRKIKLRDMTKEDFAKWKEKKCVKISCKDCVFCKAPCTEPNDENSWINNKDLYSDKFLNQEVEIEMPILDEIEKKYLRNIIKPFRDRVIYIKKNKLHDKYFIVINIYSDFTIEKTDYIDLPFFKNDMYKGMEVGKNYTLEALGL